MTAAKNPAVAAGTSPLRSVEVQGDTINVDDSKSGTWKAFELSAIIGDGNSSPNARTNAMFGLIEYATDTTKQDIIDKLGGDNADAQSVMEYALEVISHIVSKN